MFDGVTFIASRCSGVADSRSTGVTYGRQWGTSAVNSVMTSLIRLLQQPQPRDHSHLIVGESDDLGKANDIGVFNARVLEPFDIALGGVFGGRRDEVDMGESWP